MCHVTRGVTNYDPRDDIQPQVVNLEMRQRLQSCDV